METCHLTMVMHKIDASKRTVLGVAWESQGQSWDTSWYTTAVKKYASIVKSALLHDILHVFMAWLNKQLTNHMDHEDLEV